MRVRGHSTAALRLAAILALTALSVPLWAGQDQVAQDRSPSSAPQPKPHEGVRKEKPVPSAALSAAGVLKMAQAGVSEQVIMSLIAHAPVVQTPSPEDVIALKQQGLPDEVATALIQRSADTRAAMTTRFLAQLRAQGANASASPNASANANAPLDPESYAFFQHYYLFPRTLASVYDQLGYYRYLNTLPGWPKGWWW